MKRFFRLTLKLLKYGAIAVVVILVGALLFLVLRFPRVAPASAESFEATPARLERGAYLLNHVVDCLNCHSPRDWDLYSGPVIAGSEGQGAPVIDQFLEGYSANVTPYGIGDWTDGEVARAITSGINRDGKAMHPLMPYDVYLHLSEEDVKALVVGLRQLAPVEHDVPVVKQDSVLKSLLVFVVRRIVPQPYEPKPTPPSTDTLAYGKYLARIGQCTNCHGSRFKGGFVYPLPNGDVSVAADISSTSETRAGTWSRENFIGVFKSYDSPEARQVPLAEGQDNSIMAWTRFAGMTEEDLGAIYDYIQSVPPPETEGGGEGDAEGSEG